LVGVLQGGGVGGHGPVGEEGGGGGGGVGGPLEERVVGCEDKAVGAGGEVAVGRGGRERAPAPEEERLSRQQRVGGAVEGGPERGVSAVDERELPGVEEAQRGDGFAEARRGPDRVVGLGGGGVVESDPGRSEGEDDGVEHG